MDATKSCKQEKPKCLPAPQKDLQPKQLTV